MVLIMRSALMEATLLHPVCLSSAKTVNWQEDWSCHVELAGQFWG